MGGVVASLVLTLGANAATRPDDVSSLVLSELERLVASVDAGPEIDLVLREDRFLGPLPITGRDAAITRVRKKWPGLRLISDAEVMELHARFKKEGLPRTTLELICQVDPAAGGFKLRVG